MTGTRHRYPTTPIRMAETFESLAGEADLAGAKGSGQKLRAIAAELRADPCGERIQSVAKDVAEARALARDALDAGDLPRPVYLLWLRAEDIAGHPKKLDMPSGIATMPPEKRREVLRKAIAGQPRPGSAEAVDRTVRAVATKRSRRTISPPTPEAAARGRAARWHGGAT